MKSRSIKPSVLRLLYAHSGNQCAFPGCEQPIFEDNGQLTGECCHIEAFSKNGPRYNPHLSDDKCNDYNNLVLMCSRHHKIIDGDTITYSVEHLNEIKYNHESKYLASTIKLTHSMMAQLQESSRIFWSIINKIHSEDTSELHRSIDTNLSATELMNIVELNFSDIEKFMEFFEISDNQLMNNLRNLCKRIGWNFDKIDKLPSYENPFFNPNWEMHNLGRGNIMCNARMDFYTLIIKVLELLSINDNSYCPILEEWRSKFLSFQKTNFYFD